MKKKMEERPWIIVSVIIIAFLLFIWFGFGGIIPYRDYGQWGAYLTYGYGWMGIFVFIIWILVIVFLVLGIVWLFKKLMKK